MKDKLKQGVSKHIGSISIETELSDCPLKIPRSDFLWIHKNQM